MESLVLEINTFEGRNYEFFSLNICEDLFVLKNKRFETTGDPAWIGDSQFGYANHRQISYVEQTIKHILCSMLYQNSPKHLWTPEIISRALKRSADPRLETTGLEHGI